MNLKQPYYFLQPSTFRFVICIIIQIISRLHHFTLSVINLQRTAIIAPPTELFKSRTTALHIST